MRRALRILLLIVIFIAAVVVFFFIFNKGAKTEDTLEEKAGLPVVYMQQDGQWINELHGYRTEMSEVSMRDTILQMPEDVSGGSETYEAAMGWKNKNGQRPFFGGAFDNGVRVSLRSRGCDGTFSFSDAIGGSRPLKR